MKKKFAIIASIILLATNGPAIGQHRQPQQSKVPRPGDTVFPGSTEWLHVGSPRNSVTGEEVILIWGADGKLHPIGYAIEDTDGSWVANTPVNQETVIDHKETMLLKAAVREIMRESPDRKIVRPVKARNQSIMLHDTGYDPYKFVMHWADSIGRVFDDPDFVQEMEQYYRQPKNGLWLTPYYEPSRD